MHLPRLHVFTVGARVANMRIGQCDDLAAIGRIREDLLVSRHSRVEDDLADGLAFGANRSAMENRAILKCQ